MTHRFTRRSLLGTLAAGSGLLAAPAILRAQQLFVADPFSLGVAAGDPVADGFVIWTRLCPDPMDAHGGMPMAPVAVDWEVASDMAMRDIVAKGTELARPELAHSVHVEVAGLKPARPYWYRFRVGAEKSMRGQAMTLPLPGAAVDRVRFAVAGCQHYQEGYYTAFRHLADEDAAFVFHYGDYIYEDRGNGMKYDYDGSERHFVRRHWGQATFTLDDYRRRYTQTKLDTDLQDAHAAAAWFVTPDDHEVEDNWVGLDSKYKVPPEVFALRRAAAFQAFYEHMPLRKSAFPGASGMQVYRRALYGNLLDLHFLDTRQFRSDQPCGDGFVAVCAGVGDVKAQVLGAAQEAWLDGNLRQKAGRWNAIAQQVMMMPLDRRLGEQPVETRNMDSWGGYDAPRERLLSRFAGLGNVVVLTGDEHQNFAGELRRGKGEGDAVAVEFVATSITSGGDGADKRAGAERVKARNPFLKYSGDRRGYLMCDVTPADWQTQCRTVPMITQPGAPISTAATITVEHGRPALNIAS
ncbi:alkaline phosphatase [Sphingobium sp. SCG-1]|uniref:alkaline phosphatase D family protein n=1 Tax=Sphingobium sp. SCG-1 TaxID=2072936 RepID=UPI000CD6A83D|nr:alkaline phosphatase D family protein [Sphingobium sp. SCG-1]AUW59054.1 alkaline phosphatase [Sphingobium sp. SCG-1]